MSETVFHQHRHYRKIYDSNGDSVTYKKPDKSTRKKLRRIDRQVAGGYTDREAKEYVTNIKERLESGGQLTLRTRDAWGIKTEQEQSEIDAWLQTLTPNQRRKFRR